jgi:hypothetical protein
MSFGRDIDDLYFGLDGEPISRERWIEMWEDIDVKRIGYNEVGSYHVSTVWLGINHSFGDGPPVIFETMIFGEGPLDQEQWRYCTRQGAEKGHRAAVDLVNAENQLEERP